MKRISPATVTLGVMAIVLGLVAAYIVRQSLRQPPVVEAPPPPAPKPDLVQVVFAKNNLPKHARITADDLFVALVGKESKAANGTFRNLGAAEGRITTQAIRSGQAIRDEYLLGIGEGLPDLAERLPPGHRAVTIHVQGAEGSNKFDEGDHVDLAIIVEGTHPDLGEVMTRTLLRNVLVMDAVSDRSPVRRTARPTDAAAATITVAVPPADANKLIVAERTGTLVATLVSSKDIEAGVSLPDSDAITRRQLLGLKELPPPPPPPVPPPPPKKFTVEKWSGSSVRLIEMSDDRIRESREVSFGGPQHQIPAPAQDLLTSTSPQASSVASGVKLPGPPPATTTTAAAAVR